MAVVAVELGAYRLILVVHPLVFHKGVFPTILFNPTPRHPAFGIGIMDGDAAARMMADALSLAHRDKSLF